MGYCGGIKLKEKKLFVFCVSFLLISFVGVCFGGRYFLEELKVSILEEYIPPGETIELTGRLYCKEEKPDYQILYLKNISVIYQNKSFKQSRIIIYNKKNNENLKLGNCISCEGKLRFFEGVRNPGNFNQKFYYQKQNIHAAMWAESVRIQDEGVYMIRDGLNSLKCEWKKYFQKTTGEKYGGILCAMLLGDKTIIDPEIKELYQVNGIAHILAISGLHLSLVGHSIYQLVRKISGSYLAGGIAGFLLMGSYILMIGLSVSAFRAVVMFVIRVGADMSGRVYDASTAVALAAVLVIIWRPLSFYDAGFQLSFGAIVGVLFISPLIMNYMAKKKIKNFVLNSIVVNVSIQLSTFPILLYHYYEFPLYSILLNLLVVPLVGVILMLAFVGVMMNCLTSLLGGICLHGCICILKGYEKLCQYATEIPYSRVITGKPVLASVVGYYVCLLLAVWILFLARTRSQKKMLALFVPGIIILLLGCPWGNQRNMEITILDVGQGECIFVQEGSFSCLIDGGSSSENQVGKYRIEPFLKAKGIDELDYVFVSHGDSDHISGIEEMLKRQKVGIQIKCLVFPEESVWSEELYELARMANVNGVKTFVMHAGNTVAGKQLKIKCLYPDGAVEQIEIGNATSMVLDLSYGEWNMIATGDIEKEGEKKLISLLNSRYDVLKVSHHGSKYSTTEEFLGKVLPKVAVVSAGEDNSYGHPHDETLKRLGEKGCEIYITKDSGAIRIQIDKEKMCLEEYVEKE